MTLSDSMWAPLRDAVPSFYQRWAEITAEIWYEPAPANEELSRRISEEPGLDLFAFYKLLGPRSRERWRAAYAHNHGGRDYVPDLLRKGLSAPARPSRRR